jgi:hypothetical protein
MADRHAWSTEVEELLQAVLAQQRVDDGRANKEE